MKEKIGDALRARLQSAREYDTFDVNIFMAGEPLEMAQPPAETNSTEAISEPAVREMNTAVVVERLQQQAAQRQDGVLNFLAGFADSTNFANAERTVVVPKVNNVRSFWINNAIGAEVTLDVLRSLLERPDVVHIELTHRADLSDLIDAPKTRSGVRASAKKKKGKAAPANGANSKNGDGRKAPITFDVLEFVKSGVTFAAFVGGGTADPEATWSVKRVGAPLLWQLGLNGDGVLVAVIDTGVNYNHPDLQNRMWDGGNAYPYHGYDFASNDNNPLDEGENGIGHGTACAGIVAGDGTSGIKTGVAPGSRIMAIRVNGKDERNFWDAYSFAMVNRVHVITMSITWKATLSPDYPGLRRVCEAVLAAGILHTNSTGNEGTSSTSGSLQVPFNIGAPANCPPPRMHPLQAPPVGAGLHFSSVISCGSTDDADCLLDYSGRGPCAWENGDYTDYPFANGAQPGLIKPDVCAPGSLTDSCNWRFNIGNERYIDFYGSSSATAHVAGCMALLAQACLRSKNPIIPGRVQEALENSAARIPGQSHDKEINFGAGRVDVFAAFNYGLDKNRNWWS